jgi:hypothetical protein
MRLCVPLQCRKRKYKKIDPPGILSFCRTVHINFLLCVYPHGGGNWRIFHGAQNVTIALKKKLKGDLLISETFHS